MTKAPRWPHGVFALVSLVFCWAYLGPRSALIPTDLNTIAPWAGAAPVAASRPSNPLMTDALFLTYPARVHGGEELRAGRIPFWNPRIFCGYPHLAHIQNNTLYPLAAVFDLVDPVGGMGYAIALHLALAGSLMFLFLWDRGLDPRAALLGGLAFELNGFFLVRLSAPSYVFSGTWLPLMLLGVGRLARSGLTKKGLALAIATALSVLGGHPQITGLSLVVAAAYLTAQAFLSADIAPWPLRLRASLQFLFLVGLGVGLAGFQVVPFLELVSESARGAFPLDVYRTGALPAPGLLQALLPNVFGHPVDGDYWFDRFAGLLDGVAPERRPWAFNYSGENLYTGPAVLVLAGLAFLRGRRRPDAVFFGGVAVLGVAVLLGTPVLDVAYRLVPGFATSRPDRVAFVVIAALTILAATGFDASLGRNEGPWHRHGSRLLLVPLGLGAVLAVWALAPYAFSADRREALLRWLGEAREITALRGPRFVRDVALVGSVLAAAAALSRRRLLGSRAGIVLWAALVVVPPALFGWHFNPAQAPPRLGTTGLVQVVRSLVGDGRIARTFSRGGAFLPPNLPQVLGVDDVHGASAAGLKRYVRLTTAADPDAFVLQKYFMSFRRPVPRLLDLLGATVVFSDEALPLPDAGLPPSGPIRAYRNPTALPRHRLVFEVEVVADPKAAMARLLSPAFDPAVRAVVAGPLPSAFSQGGGLDLAPAVRAEHVEPERIELRVRSPRPALLVTSEVFYPGWDTLVDGRRTETLLVNGAFRGAFVPPGEHRVVLQFVPRSFYVGLGITVAAVVVLVALAVRK